jgi:hypothetical protein
MKLFPVSWAGGVAAGAGGAGTGICAVTHGGTNDPRPTIAVAARARQKRKEQFMTINNAPTI